MNTLQRKQIANEKEVLYLVKLSNKNGEGYKPCLIKKSLFNAIDRLVEKGVIKYKKSRNYSVSGYYENKTA